MVQHTRRVGEEDQFLGTQCDRQFTSDGVCIDVVSLAILTGTDGSDHGNEISLIKGVDDSRIDGLDFTHESQFHCLSFIGGAFLAQHQLTRPDQSAVLARQAHGAAAMSIDQGHDILVDESTQYHLNHIDGFTVCHAKSLDKLALLANPVEQLADLGAAAMHNDRVHADQLHQNDIPGETALQRLVGHGVAAILDHNGAAVKMLYVRQGFCQYRRDGCRIWGLAHNRLQIGVTSGSRV